MKVHCVRVCCRCAVVPALLLLAGCEDPDSRVAGNEAGKKVIALTARLESLEKKADDTAQSLKAAEERLLKHIDERADELSKTLNGKYELLTSQTSQSTAKNLQDATNLAQASREEYQRDLTVEKASMAAEVQKMREELKASVEELRRTMDNQLKETYPYAYQPRRMDPAAPPGVSDKTAPPVEKPADQK